MDSVEARIVLGAFPAGDWPAEDPFFREALSLAETDRELAAWLRTNRDFDAAVSICLRNVVPPADLKAEILAGRRPARIPERDDDPAAGISRVSLMGQTRGLGGCRPSPV